MSPQAISATVFALNVVLQVTVLSLLALIASRFLYKRNPGLKYAVCLSSLVCFLLSPAAVCIQLQTGYGIARIALPDLLAKCNPVPSESYSPINGSFGPVESSVVSQPASWSSYALWIAFGVWIVGLALGVFRLIGGWRNAGKVKRETKPWQDSEYAGIRENAQRVLGSHLPPILASDSISMPLATGVFRPAVILPEGIGEMLTGEQVQQVLLHECAHIKFKHALSGLLDRLVRVVFWPHPLVHAVCHELAAAREEVCDNVASQESGAACYARTLLTMAMAQGSLTAPQIASALTLLGPETGLEERIIGLLDPRRNRMVQTNRWKLWAVTGTAICALVSTAAIRVIAAGSEPAAKKVVSKTVATRSQSQQPGDVFVTRLDGVSADVVIVGPNGERLDRPSIDIQAFGQDLFIVSDNGEELGSIHLDGKGGNGQVILQDGLAQKKAAEAKQKANVVKRAPVKAGATPAEALAAKRQAEQDAKANLARIVKLERIDPQTVKTEGQVVKQVIDKVTAEKAARLK